MPEQSFDPHAKILHSGQYIIKKNQDVFVPIKAFSEELNEEQLLQERIAELKNDIQAMETELATKEQYTDEKVEKIIFHAKDEAGKILEEAEQHAFDKVKESEKEKESVIQKAQEAADRIISEAEQKASGLIGQAKADAGNIREDARKTGQHEGYEQGLENGSQDISSIISRLHAVIAQTARERERILVHSENQVINLVLTMVRKVVKQLTSEHQEIVVENTKAALQLLRNSMTIFIRVSSHDFNYLYSFKDKLVSMIEARAELNFIEDPTIEPGGVYIETEMGDIDATIRGQLEELTSQMSFYMPVKVKSPEQKRRGEQDPIVVENDTQMDSVVPTPTAQKEEYISTVEYQEPISDTSSPEDLEQNDGDTAIDIEPLNESDGIEIISDEEMNSDSTIREALDSYKDASGDSPSHDEDLTV